MLLDNAEKPYKLWLEAKDTKPKDTKPNSEFIVFKYTDPEQSEMEKLEAYKE